MLTPDGVELGRLTGTSRARHWRPTWHIEPAEGEKLTGRSGTVASWTLFFLLFPLWLVFNLAWMLEGTGEMGWDTPKRAAWKEARGFHSDLIAPLKFYGFTERYKHRTARLDRRLAYAQIVVHSGSAEYAI